MPGNRVAGRLVRLLGRTAGHLMALLVVVFLLLPFVISLLVSLNPGRSIGVPTPATGITFEWYAQVLTDRLYQQGLTSSLLVGVLVAVVSVGLALPLVIGMGRAPRLRRLGALVVLPLAVPSVVLGMQSLVAFEAAGVRGSLATVVAVHTIWGLPLAMLVLRAAHDRLDPGLVEAARSLGAGPARATWEVVVPLLAPATAVAALLGFIASLNELVMTVFVAGGNVRTLPTVVWPKVRHSVGPDVAAASSLLLLAAVVASAAAWWLWDRRASSRRG